MNGELRVWYEAVGEDYRHIKTENQLLLVSPSSPGAVIFGQDIIEAVRREFPPTYPFMTLLEVTTVDEFTRVSNVLELGKCTRNIAILNNSVQELNGMARYDKDDKDDKDDIYVIALFSSASRNLKVDANPLVNLEAAALSVASAPTAQGFNALPQDLHANNILDMDQRDAPSGVTEVRDRLLGKRKLSSSAVDTLSSVNADLVNIADEFDIVSDEEDMAMKREGTHYCLVGNSVDNQDSYQKGEQLTIGALFLHKFVTESCIRPSLAGLQYQADTKAWPEELYLMIIRQNQPHRYSPKSDFSLWFRFVPLLLMEICSNPSQLDRIRLFFQGAALVSILNWVTTKGAAPDPGFVLPLIYINKEFEAEVYLMYETEEGFSYWEIHRYALKEAIEKVRFLKVLYNITSRVEGLDLDLDYIKKAFEALVSQKSELPTFRKTYRRRVQGGNAEEGNAEEDSAEEGNNMQVDEVGHTYEVLRPLVTPSSTSAPPDVYVTSTSGRCVVAKRIYKGSLESAILQSIRSFAQPSNGSCNVIALLDIFWRDGYEWIVLPLLRPFDMSPTSDKRILRFASELANGIQFLHDIHIAHLDIKPDNLVLTELDHLKIIDFSESVFVKDENEMIVGFVGTPGYMAPEIADKTSTFSPIKADRFSYGCVLSCFYDWCTDKHPAFLAFAEQLKHSNPSKRPLLREWSATLQ